MVFLGIDPGIADTGFGVIEKSEKNKLTCLDYGSIRTSAKLALPERLEILFCEIEKIIQKYQPSSASIEELFFCNNAKTALIVGQARGVLLLALKKNKIPIQEFTPLQVKQSVSNYGRADKTQVQKMVKLILNLAEIPRPDDAADALAVAICGSNYQLKIKN